MPERPDRDPYREGRESVDSRTWGAASLRLHLGWLARQLIADPRDEYRWGRFDAMSDLLSDRYPADAMPDLGALRGVLGEWRKAG